MFRLIIDRLRRALRMSPRQVAEKQPEPTAVEASDEAPLTQNDEAAVRVRVASVTTEKLDLIVGLDFGTSCTKVVIRAPYLGQGWAVAVRFDNLSHARNSYLLPSVAHFIEDGIAQLGVGDNERLPMAESMKVRLMDRSLDMGVRAEAAAYLALVLRHAREWFIREYRDMLVDREPRWQMNLGIPSDGRGETPLSEAFGQVGKAAWSLCTSKGPVTLAASRAAIAEVTTDDDASEVGIIPEVIAEVVGYARSHHRREGLHLLVDVGASTLDICGFIIQRVKGEDEYPQLERAVFRLGTLALHRRRMEVIGLENCANEILALDLQDPLCVIPDDAYSYSTGALRADLSKLSDDRFREECIKALWKCLMPLRKRRDPNSESWKAGLPVYLCGGGALIQFYHQIAKAVSREATKIYAGVSPFQVKTLPRPMNLQEPDMTDQAYQRLAVAYGLGFDRLDIGRIWRPEQVEDVAPRRKRQPKEYVSKDYV